MLYKKTTLALQGRLASIAGICSGCIVIALVFTMVNTAIPSIASSLNMTMSSLKWMMTLFGIVNCACLVTSGRLADIYGRKKLYLIGLAFSGAGMLSGGVAEGSGGLLFAMSLAGVGNAILLPVSQAMLVSAFGENERGEAIGLWAASLALAMAIGPLMGGLITSTLGWRFVFLSTVPVVCASALLVAVFSKESKNTLDIPAVDYLGMLSLGITLFASLLVATEFHHLSKEMVVVLVLLAVSSALFLYWNEKKFPSPIILQELVFNRMFIFSSLASGCLIFYLWATFFILPIYLQTIRNFSAAFSGVIMLGITIPVAFLAPLIGKLYRKHTAWLWTFAGFALLAASMAMQMFFAEDSSLFFILAAVSLFGLGYSLAWGPPTVSAISTVSVDKAGIASGSFMTIQEIGGTVGLAFVVSSFSYQRDLLSGYHQGVNFLLGVGVLGLFFAVLMFSSAGVKRY